MIRIALPSPKSVRWNYVDLVLWVLRVVILIVVAVGILGTLRKGSYGAAQWFDLVAYGLTIGGIYALVALGFTMVFGVLRTINFAHGDVTMTGTYVAFFVASSFDRSGFLNSQPLLAMAGILAVAMCVCAFFALLVERTCYRPFRHVATSAPLICAVGASFVLQYGFRGLFGSATRAYPDPEWLRGTVELGVASIPAMQLLVILIALVSMAGLYVLVHRTRTGTAMRAVAEDRDTAALMGVDSGRIISFTFMLGGCMAGIGGVLYGIVFKEVHYSMGFLLGIKAFSAAVLGGIGNIPAAMLGGIFLGVVESVGPLLVFDGVGVPAPYQLRDLISFSALVIVLIFRPRGIFGERVSAQRA